MQLDLLMPARGDHYAPLAAEAAEDYRPAFAARGIALAPVPWDEAPGRGDAALALFAWGYHFAPDRWQALLAAWPAARPLINPPSLLAWNARKTYLLGLERAGVPIVPSWFGDAGADSIAAAFARFATDTLVVKPQISAGSHLTQRVSRGEAVAPLARAIIQPYQPAVEAEGELSLLFIGGAFSHAVRKVARAGDFRIQPQFGGTLTAVTAAPDARPLAAQALAALPEPPAYARIDLIRLTTGGLAVMEVEASEPDLYPELGNGVADRLAAAVAARLEVARLKAARQGERGIPSPNPR